LFYLVFSVNEYGKTYTVDIELPNLHVDGKYYIDGRILVIPVKGGGKLSGDFSKLNKTKDKNKTLIYLFIFFLYSSNSRWCWSSQGTH
jgi:hypothetical protein